MKEQLKASEELKSLKDLSNLSNLQNLQDLLYSKGVYSRYKGYDYFVHAVELAIEEPNRLKHIKKEIYTPIAEKFQTNVSSVERCMITVRDVFVANNGIDLLIEMGGSSCWKDKNPYPKDMIDIFASYLKKSHKIKK